jgi:ribosome biogenesis GTPase
MVERASSIPADAEYGIVVQSFGKFFAVQLDDGRSLLSTLRGGLKREKRKTDIVAVGDRVLVSDVGEGEGRIHEVEPRKRALSRLARHTDDTEQVILANPDQALFLFAVREPDPHPRLLDRFLVMAESRDLPAIVAVNKIDLDADDDQRRSLFEEMFGRYADIYPVRRISVRTGEGLQELKSDLAGKITAVAGPSGVGKSSLLNALDPSRARLIGEVSQATGKGRHTTSSTVLYRVPGSPPTFVADTPGIRALSLQGIDLTELDTFFPEMRPFLEECRFTDCRHLDEAGCAVKAAVATGEISSARYESYVALMVEGSSPRRS